ncbi:nuclear transport factor 2 family protein [Achromobacter aegrifaciens]
MENPVLLMQAKAACEAVVLEFFHALDTRRHEAAAALMAEDGVWQRQGRRLAGRNEILDALNARAPERSTCHIITNLRLVELTGERATVGYFLTAYESVPNEQGGAPRLVSIRECQDVLSETDGGWRLAEKSSRRHLPPE